MNFYFSHGRTAFKYGLINFGIKKNDKIMMPEYICDVLLDPLKKLGVKPIFYRIKDNFTIDWDSIQKNYRNSVKALVVLNYFGFEEEKKQLSNFCKKKKIFLIEDDCHSLNLYKKKNNFSDFEFFSTRKIIKKSYSGGILQINRNIKEYLLSNIKLKKFNVTFFTILNNYLENNFLLIKRFLKYKFLNMPNFYKLNHIKNEKIFDDLLIDDFSKSFFTKKNLAKIKRIRYKNYMVWKNFCKKIESSEMIKRNLNKNKIPWLFPVFIKDKEVRKKIFRFGWKNGYSIISWPSLPNQLINERNKSMWNKLVCFDTDRAPNKEYKDFKI